MASKLGGAEPVRGSSGPRASRAKATLENGLHVNGNSQSNPRRSNPPGGAARSRSALRLWGTRLGLVPHDAPDGRGMPPSLARWSDVEPRTWLRSAPHVGGDRRTTGRLTAIRCDRMPQGVYKVNVAVTLATNTLAVKGSIPDGRIPPWGGQYSELLRVRAYTACRCVRTYTDDDTVPRDSRSAPNLNLREEGRRISQGSGADHGGRRVLSRHFAHQTVSALRGAGAVAHPSRRSISSGDARAAGKREATVGHQAAAFRSIANSVSVVSSGNALLISGHAWRGNLFRCFQTRTLPTLAEIRWANSATPTAAITDAGVEFMPHTLHGVMRSASTSLHAITRRAVIFPHGR